MTSLIHHRACNLCEAICGLEITVENGTVTRIEGDKNDPLSKGYLCPKAYALKDIYEDPNRLKQPIRKRDDGSWETIGWDEAYDYIVQNLQNIQAKWGQNAVGIYLGNPSVHNVGTTLNVPAFIKSLKTKNIFSATSLDQLPSHFAAWAMFGHPLLIPIPDVSRTDFMLIMGGNPLASNGSLMTAPDMGSHLKNIQKRGGKVVVVDPRRTETAEKATEHHFIRPASDVFLLLAMLNVILWETIPQHPILKNHTEGVEFLAQAVTEFTPESVENQVGMSAQTIRALAMSFVNAKSAVAYGRMGLSVQKFGGLCQWLINCLNIVTGNLDRVGGAMFTSPALDILAQAKFRTVHGRWHSRVRGLPETLGELPTSVLAEEILTEGEGQIKAMITNAGNPILSSPNGQQLDKAFESLEFMVAIDIYLNETTRHANIILPPATGLETAHYDTTFHILAIKNTAKYSPPVFQKQENQRYDWEILQNLTHRLSNTEGAYAPEPPEKKLDLGLRFGAYQLSVQQLLDNPSGIDLGDLKPVLPQRLVFEDKKIRLVHDVFLKDLERAKGVLKNTPPQYQKDFQLIGRRHLRDNNSWMHNSEKLMKGKNRCTVLMNKTDAESLQIIDKQQIKVSSRVGSVELPVEITDDIMQGVVSIPHGYGHNRKGIKLDVAEKYAGVSINDLTDEMDIDELTGNAVLNGVWVKIEKI
ncbi:MAG: molybdopterin-dependent oxidoreductase [Saprospiraceae bacterium]|nr:molybdopterin-dependent oxidoreductase [Saprospiraceae bacterium]